MDRTEEEQIEHLKDMWRRHGVPILVGAGLALAAVAGWKAWVSHQESQAAGASSAYQTMLETILTADDEASRSRAAELADQLREDYANTRYAEFAGLMQARLAADAGDFAGAETLLENVVQSTDDGALAEIARQRLARVLAQQDRAEAGLELFSGEVSGLLLAGREEVRGDLLVSLGRHDEARQAYQAAIEATEDPRNRPQLQLKLDDLAEEA
ncbi:Putative negative regulator of RcsB-dependent stress response [Halopseudomonas xinjiangensis]|uniref:Ancillary SecYEG translocon subunit n=1 Tax=Halopseudomonas xinjiangensis TaxID=487184 RepID=A0A1H1LKB7_9GAMM|nr:tetratricopeptide repeat protein [Halopseudomonas xinjiangensis]SDR74958.1 Putative negative regulator of RcsB-dependent stress response [Halopseudomonas xinjiangensis]